MLPGLPSLRKPDPRLPATDLTGKVCLVTGATAGHGLACAKALASLGAEVVLLGRNPAKCERVQVEILAQTGKRPEILVCDLSSRADIDRAAAEWLAQGRPLHLLLNNAGLVRRHREETVDGVEVTFAVNYLAYYQLTLRLMPRLLASPPARIVLVASDAHRMVDLPLHDLQNRFGYNFMTAYSHSKLAIVYFTRALALKLIGSGVTVNACDPGPIASEIADDNPGLVAPLASWLIKRVFPTPARAARTALHLAASPEVEGTSGTYWRFMQVQQPKVVAQDRQVAQRLWEISARMTGVDWPA